MGLLSLLESVIGRSKKTSGNNVSFKCPLCNHYKHKLEIDLNTQYWHCWVCNAKGRKLYTLFKKINATRLSETKKVGRGNVKVLTENAQQANKELEKLEKDYDRNLKRIKGWKELIGKKELKGNVEFIFDKVMKEQNFLKAGNDWVLQ